MRRKTFNIEYFERKKIFTRTIVKAKKRELKRFIEKLQAEGHLVTLVEERN